MFQKQISANLHAQEKARARRGGSNHSSPECDVAPAMGEHMASCMTKD